MSADASHAARARPPSGFTLLELITVMAILAMLAGIAVPFPGQAFQDARRQDGLQLLHLNAQRLQRCFTLEGVYDGSCWLRTESRNGYYRLEADTAPSTWTLRAVPVAGGRQARDSHCATLVYGHTGAKGATGSEPDLCW